jgi:hypothetical protein
MKLRIAASLFVNTQAKTAGGSPQMEASAIS